MYQFTFLKCKDIHVYCFLKMWLNNFVQNRFTIFLACSVGLDKDSTNVDNVPNIAIAFDVRYPGITHANAIVINHRTENVWGVEHVFPNHTFKVNIPFQLEITLLPGLIEVSTKYFFGIKPYTRIFFVTRYTFNYWYIFHIQIDHKGERKYSYKHAIDQIHYFGYGGNLNVSSILTT